MKFINPLLASALLIPQMHLRAQSAPEKPRFVQAGIALNLGASMGNLKTDFGNQISVAGSFILPIQVNQGWVIRPRVDFSGWTGKDRLHDGGSYRENVDARSFGAGADLLFFPGKDSAQGFFVTGGLGVQRWKLNYKAADKPAGLPTYSTETNLSKTSPSFALGAGYQFNRTFGLEFRAMTSEYAVLNKTVSAGTLIGGTRGTRHGTNCQLAMTSTW